MTEAVIEVRDLACRHGNQTVFRGLDWSVPREDFAVLLGANGCGKSTLLRLLIGCERRTSGSVRVLGKDPAKHGPALRSRVGFVPPEGDVLPWMTVDECLAFHAGVHPRWSEPRAEELVESLGVPRKTRFGALSRGESRRAHLLLALAAEPELLLLDEPFAGIDPEARDALLAGVLEEVARRPCTVVCITHDLDAAARLGRSFWHVAEGTIRPLAGALDEAVRPESLRRTLKDEASLHLALAGEPR